MGRDSVIRFLERYLTTEILNASLNVLDRYSCDKVLIREVSDSAGASTYKAIKQGSAHKRVPDDIAENPVIIGYEMCSEIVQVGDNMVNQLAAGNL